MSDGDPIEKACPSAAHALRAASSTWRHGAPSRFTAEPSTINGKPRRAMNCAASEAAAVRSRTGGNTVTAGSLPRSLHVGRPPNPQWVDVMEAMIGFPLLIGACAQYRDSECRARPEGLVKRVTRDRAD